VSSDKNPGQQFALAILIVVLLGLACQWLAAAEPCIESMEFEPKAAAAMFPLQRYEFKIRVRVARHADHRLLDLAYDGPVSGRSTRQLDGDEDAVTQRFQFRDLPGGRYVFTARVLDNKGKVVGGAELKTICPAEDERCE
jgi:hypothetical protein